MSFGIRRSAVVMSLFASSVVTSSAFVRADEPAGEPFPAVVKTDVGGQAATLKRHGTAYRKKLGIKFYCIAGYCCSSVAPRDVDAVASADVAKRLVLVMERDIPDWILRRSFEDAFAANDPNGLYPEQIKTMLDHITARPLTKGDSVTITHVPKTGVTVQVGAAPAIAVNHVGFAHVVWNVYMGPQGVDANLRTGLGTELAKD